MCLQPFTFPSDYSRVTTVPLGRSVSHTPFSPFSSYCRPRQQPCTLWCISFYIFFSQFIISLKTLFGFPVRSTISSTLPAPATPLADELSRLLEQAAAASITTHGLDSDLHRTLGEACLLCTEIRNLEKTHHTTTYELALAVSAGASLLNCTFWQFATAVGVHASRWIDRAVKFTEPLSASAPHAVAQTRVTSYHASFLSASVFPKLTFPEAFHKLLPTLHFYATDSTSHVDPEASI